MWQRIELTTPVEVEKVIFLSGNDQITEMELIVFISFAAVLITFPVFCTGIFSTFLLQQHLI